MYENQSHNKAVHLNALEYSQSGLIRKSYVTRQIKQRYTNR